MARELITLEHIYKSYGDQLVLDDLSLMIKENSFVTLLGPSGCGKTTTLRIIGGFEYPDSGAVVFDGKNSLHPNFVYIISIYVECLRQYVLRIK